MIFLFLPDNLPAAALMLRPSHGDCTALFNMSKYIFKSVVWFTPKSFKTLAVEIQKTLVRATGSYIYKYTRITTVVRTTILELEQQRGHLFFAHFKYQAALCLGRNVNFCGRCASELPPVSKRRGRRSGAVFTRMVETLSRGLVRRMPR